MEDIYEDIKRFSGIYANILLDESGANRANDVLGIGEKEDAE